MDHPQKKLLIVQTKAPFGTSSIQESLDIVLAAGTFDQDISLLIQSDACFQFLSDQNPNQIHQKNTGKMLKALPIYGVENIFIDELSARERGIKNIDDIDFLQAVDKAKIKALYQSADIVLRF